MLSEKDIRKRINHLWSRIKEADLNLNKTEILCMVAQMSALYYVLEIDKIASEVN